MTSTQEQAQEAAAQAKDKAGEAAQQARGRVREQVDQRSTQAGERVSEQASDVRSIASTLRDEGKEQPAKLAEQAADRAERLGGYLQDADADRILGDIEDFGRRQPMALVFGGLALGFVASRFVKASSQERYAASTDGSRPRTTSRPERSTATYGTGTYGSPPADLPATGTETTFPEPAIQEERTDGPPPVPPSTYPVWGR